MTVPRIQSPINQERVGPTDARSVLIIVLSTVSSDPRVMRQVRLLESRYKVLVIGFGKKPDANIDFLCLDRPNPRLLIKLGWGLKLLLGLSESYYWSRVEIQTAWQTLRNLDFALVVANDIDALPLAVRLAKGRSVLIDAHEYSPREFDDRWLWRLLFGRHYHKLCRRYLPKVDGMTTVCQSIADEYANHYAVTPSIVYNAPPKQDLRPSPTVPGRIRLVHHGATIRSRHLELMFEVMRRLDDRFTLDLFLTDNDPDYLNELRALAVRDKRIHFRSPVPLAEICRTLNCYDMGVFLLPPVNFNYANALPNKFFEFIQARLAVAIGPSPEMAKFVNTYRLGVIAESFEPASLASPLNAMCEAELVRYKLASNVAADSLNDEVGSRVLQQMVERLVSRRGALASTSRTQS